MRCISVLGAIALASMFVPAHAADLGRPSVAPIYKAPVPMGRADYSGCYVGVSFGYAQARRHTDYRLGGFQTVPIDTRASGAMAGGQGGCDVEFARIVAGVKGDLMLGGIKGLGTTDFRLGGFIPIHATQETTIDRSFGAVARLGYNIDGWLPNAQIGIKRLRVATNTKASVAGFSFYDHDATQSVTTMVYGGGIEKLLPGGWSVSADYLEGARKTLTGTNTFFGTNITNTGPLKYREGKISLNKRF